MSTLTYDERLENVQAYLSAKEKGDKREVEKYAKRIPLDPRIAKTIKQLRGAEGLQEFVKQGYNLSKVEAAYGQEWLTQ